MAPPYGPQSVSLTQAGGDLDLLEALRGGRSRAKTQQEMLREQSMSPVEIGSYNGIQGKFPISQGLNKIAQGLLATYMDYQARDRAQEAANEKTASDKAGVDALVTALSGRPADAPMPDDMPGVVRPAQAPLTGDPRQMALIAAMTGSSPSAARAAEFVSRQDQATEARIPAGFRANPDGSLTHILGGPADPAVMRDRTAATHVPSPPPAGFRANPDGSLTPIPGGPQSTEFLTNSRAITHPPGSGPFGGTGMDQQNYNILLNGDPSTAIYAAAYNHSANPIVRPDGSTVTPNMSAFRSPTFNPSGSGGAAPPAAPTGGVPPAAPTGGVPMPTAGQVPVGGVPPAAPTGAALMPPDGQVPVGGVSPAAQTGALPLPTVGQVPGGGPTVVQAPVGPTAADRTKLKTIETEAGAILSALDVFEKSRNAAGGTSRAMAALGAPSSLNTTYNVAALLAKGESLFNLGVLNGPDLDIIRRTLPDPATIKGGMTNNKLASEQIGIVRDLLKGKLQSAREQYGGQAPLPNAAKPSLPPIPPGWRLVE